MTYLDPSSFPLAGQQLIEASAGTGKTFTITSLYLRLLLGRDKNQTRPLLSSEILVLTFTIAATDELRQRIRDRVLVAHRVFSSDETVKDDFILQLKNESTDLDSDRKLLALAIQTMDEAAIFTIHGFCARVLGEQSFETGMLFNQDLDGDKDRLLEMATQDCFRKLILTLPDMERTFALEQWSNPEVLKNQLQRFLFRHNLTIIPAEEDVSDKLKALEAKIVQCKALWLADEITALIQSAGFHAGRVTVKHLDKVEAYCQSERLDIDFWEPWTRAKIESATTSKTTVPRHKIFQLIDEIWQGKSVIEQLKMNLWHRVCREVKQSLSNFKQQFGQLTLDDLLAEVHRALNQQDSQLASSLRCRWPVALIDEFQDTDDLQYEIFSGIYPQTEACGLFLIGDPKQAIYQFRGADIFTYINAKREIGSDPYTLDTNWRSSPPLIEAVNHLFSKPDIFGNDGDIPFHPVSSADENTDRRLSIKGVTQKPFHLFTNQLGSTKSSLLQSSMAYAAETTATLLNLAATGLALIDNSPVSAGQIAFLVRNRMDGAAARLALAERNIGSVYITLESVFMTDTADDLKLVLQAILEPGNEQLIRSALATRLMQTPITEIDKLNHDWSALQTVMQEFQDYHDIWAKGDLANMLATLTHKRGIVEKCFKDVDGERQITNLRHLGEILQQRSLDAPGMHRLVKWFSQEKLNAESTNNEERQLRLESDQHLVKIVTMHASKGLEYDIVMIPMAGFSETSKKPVLFHDQTKDSKFAAFLDLASGEDACQKEQREAIDESMRLLYVAITRARYACYLGIPLFKNIQKTALAKLLDFQSLEDQAINGHLGNLPIELFDLTDIQSVGTSQYKPVNANPDLLAPPSPPNTHSHWRIHSYTGLTRLLNKSEPEFSMHDVQPGFADDDARTQISEPQTGIEFSRFSFPRGPRVGIALHDMMENLDFNTPPDLVAYWAKRSIHKMGLTENIDEWVSVLVGWFADMVTTPLIPEVAFSLKDIAVNKRLNELEFHFPLSASQAFLSAARKAGYFDVSLGLNIPNLKGMMTGYIDLIVEHEGKFYLLDYKSNDLGPSQDNYNKEAISEAIKHHHYDLQYLIYVVALNRYLKQRLVNYQYEAHFGGVCYLFMRGMDKTPGNGCYFDRPTKALIDSLDQLLVSQPMLTSR